MTGVGRIGAVARMQRSGIRGGLPDYVSLHPGYSSEAVGLHDTPGLRLAANEPAINAQPFRPGADSLTQFMRAVIQQVPKKLRAGCMCTAQDAVIVFQ